MVKTAVLTTGAVGMFLGAGGTLVKAGVMKLRRAPTATAAATGDSGLTGGRKVARRTSAQPDRPAPARRRVSPAASAGAKVRVSPRIDFADKSFISCGLM